MRLTREPSDKLKEKCLEVFGKIIEEDKDNDVLRGDISNRFLAQSFLDKLFGDAPVSDTHMYRYHDTWKPEKAMLILAGIYPYQLPQRFRLPENTGEANVEAIIQRYMSVYELGSDNPPTQFNNNVRTLSGLSLESVLFYSSILERHSDIDVWREGEAPKTLFWALLAHIYLEISHSFVQAVILSRVWDGSTHSTELTPKYYFDWLQKKDITYKNTIEIQEFFLRNNVKPPNIQTKREAVLKDWMTSEGYKIGSKINMERADVWDELRKTGDKKLFKDTGRVSGSISPTPEAFFKKAVKAGICKFSYR